MKAYGEDSLWLPLGLPVGVVNSSQDHPRLVMSGTLKKHTNTKASIISRAFFETSPGLWHVYFPHKL